jgi:hypothetical protein
VSVAAATRPGGAHRRATGIAPLIVATVLAGAAGAALGTIVAPDRSAPPAPQEAQPRIGLRSGVARLPLPVGWEPLGRRSSLPGFEEATAVRGLHGEVALDLRAPEDPSLLPARVAEMASGLPEPQPRQLGPRTLWRYDLPAAGLVALTLPTTGGVVTLACEGTAAAGADCERAARTVWLDGASALVPAPETAAAIVLPDTIAQLNRRRAVERRRLAATRSPVRRSQAALRLAAAYADAAARVRPVAAGAAIDVAGTLGELARSHRALAAASRRRAARAAARAGARIERGERRLGAQLAAVTRR